MATPASKLSESETQFLAAIIVHLRSAPDVDWDAVLPMTTFKNKSTMMTRWGQIKKKLRQVHESNGGTAPAPAAPKKADAGGTPKTPRSGKGKRTKAGGGGGGDDDEEENASAVKKKRKLDVKKEESVSADEGGGDLMAMLGQTDGYRIGWGDEGEAM